MPEMGEMRSNLVRAPRLQPAKEPTNERTVLRAVAIALGDLIMGNGTLAVLSAARAHAQSRTRRALAASSIRTRNRNINASGIGNWKPPNESNVLALQGAVASVRGKLRGEMPGRGIILGDNNKPAGVLVETMDNPRARTPRHPKASNRNAPAERLQSYRRDGPEPDELPVLQAC